MRTRFSALGLDVGNRRIGVAGCDGTGLIAIGLGVIQRRSLSTDIAALSSWVEQREAQVLVVGLPLLVDGSMGSQAQRIQKFMGAVIARIPLPLEYINERLSTVQAEWDLRQAGLQAIHQKGVIDQQAAAVILQDWLDQRRRTLKAP